MRGRAALAVLGAVLLPGLAAGQELTTEPARILLGRTAHAELTLELDEPLFGTPPALRTAVNVGEVEDVVRLSRGRYQVRYRLPATRFPQLLLLLAWLEGDPAARVHAFRVPLHGMTRIPVTTRPGSQVYVHVAGRKHGPSRADERGEVTVPITVPPEIYKAMVVAQDDTGVSTRRPVAIQSEAYPRMVAAALPDRGGVRVEVHWTAGGVPREALRAELEDGTLERIEAGDTSQVYRWHPGQGSGPASLSFAVEGNASYRATVRVERPQPGAAPGRKLAVGVRGGFTGDLARTSTAHFGIEALAPVELFGRSLEGGLSLEYGAGSQRFTGTALWMLPITGRLALPLFARGPARLWGGAGLRLLAAGRRERDGTSAMGLGGGLLAFGGGGVQAGPATIFLELELGYMPVPAGGQWLQLGGLGLTGGFRFGF